jgi:NTP pyrophosphatase (non-canonical NTP hydrolase)
MIDKLISECTAWSEARLILKNGKRETQYLKLMEEMGELASSIAKGRDVRDDIGDCLVVLNNLAVMSGTTLEECLGIAYYQIKDRKGFLNGNGVFVKDEEALR